MHVPDRTQIVLALLAHEDAVIGEDLSGQKAAFDFGTTVRKPQEAQSTAVGLSPTEYLSVL